MAVTATAHGPVAPEVTRVTRAVKQLKNSAHYVQPSQQNIKNILKAIEDLEYVLEELDGFYPPPPPPPPIRRGKWVQANNQACQAVCAAVGLESGLSPEGAQCASGETRAASSFNKISYVHGCWPNCAPNPHSKASSVGGSCYEPGQKKDWDRTDITVGCFCKPKYGRF